MKKIVLIALPLIIIFCILIAWGLYRSPIITELLIPKQKLFAFIVNDKMDSISVGSKYTKSFAVKYVGVYEVELVFENTHGDAISISNTNYDQTKLRVDITTEDGKRVKTGNTDWLFKRTGKAGGGTVLTFHVPNNFPRKQVISMIVETVSIGSDFIDQGTSVRVLVKRMSALMR